MSDDTRTKHAPEKHWRSLLIAVCIAQATAIVGFDFTLPFIPLYLQHDLGVHGLGQTALWAGLIGFGPAIPATIFGPFWGRLADKFGYRTMLLRAMACAAALLTLMAFVPNPWVLLILRMVQGALTGTVFSSQALVAAAVPEKETGRAMGLLQMSISIGATIGPVGGGAVAQLFGYRSAFVVAGVALAVATVVVFRYVSEPERRLKVSTAEPARPSMRSVLLVPAFFTALSLTLFAQLASTSMFPVIPLYVQDLLGTAHNVATDTGWIMALSGLAAAFGSYTAGRLHRRVGLTPLLVIALALGAILLVPQAFVGSYMSFLLFRSLAAVAFGGIMCLVGTWTAVSSPPGAKGAAFGLMGAASSLGFGAGPLLGGAFAAAFGIRPLFVAAAVLVGCFPLLFLLSRLLRPWHWSSRLRVPARIQR